MDLGRCQLVDCIVTVARGGRSWLHGRLLHTDYRTRRAMHQSSWVITGCRSRDSHPPTSLTLWRGMNLTPEVLCWELSGRHLGLNAQKPCVWEAGANSSSALSHGQGSNSTSRSHLLPQRPCPPPVFPRLPSCSQSAFGPVESDLSLSIRSVFREFCCCFWAAYNSRTSRQREEKITVHPPPQPENLPRRACCIPKWDPIVQCWTWEHWFWHDCSLGYNVRWREKDLHFFHIHPPLRTP